jgi:predicted dehydrogenase
VLRGVLSGFGAVAAQAHLAGWRSRPDVSLAAIHEPSPERRHQALKLLKNVRIYDDFDLMLEGEAPDFVDIASPPAFHAAAARKALAAGAHVLVEKPLCLDPAEFDDLEKLAAANRRVLMCVHNWKHAPSYHKAHQLIASGRLGRIVHLVLTRWRPGPAGAGGTAVDGERWRTDLKSGGGILIDHGWHTLYLAQWLMGGVEPITVSAWLDRPDGGSAEDFADLRLEYPGRRLASINLSWRATVRRTSAAIFGADGAIEIDGDRLLLTDRSGKSEDYAVAGQPDDSYHAAWFAGMATEFVDAIAQGCGGAVAAGNLAEAKSAVRAIAAARRSAASDGAPMRLV